MCVTVIKYEVGGTLVTKQLCVLLFLEIQFVCGTRVFPKSRREFGPLILLVILCH